MDDANLTPQERAIVMAFEALAWGSEDVSEEEALSLLRRLRPEGWERVEVVLLARVEASRDRQRRLEEGS